MSSIYLGMQGPARPKAGGYTWFWDSVKTVPGNRGGNPPAQGVVAHSWCRQDLLARQSNLVMRGARPASSTFEQTGLYTAAYIIQPQSHRRR